MYQAVLDTADIVIPTFSILDREFDEIVASFPNATLTITKLGRIIYLIRISSYWSECVLFPPSGSSLFVLKKFFCDFCSSFLLYFLISFLKRFIRKRESVARFSPVSGRNRVVHVDPNRLLCHGPFLDYYTRAFIYLFISFSIFHYSISH